MNHNKSFLRSGIVAIITLLLFLIPSVSMAADGSSEGILIGSIPLEFFLFALVLVGVALFHKQTFWVAVIGLTVILSFKLFFDPGFHFFEHFFGTNSFADQLFGKNAAGEWMREGEWGTLVNLLGLLLGFAVLAKVFEESGIPDIVPKYLPKGWMGPFILLVFVCFISSFLDNIAAALIGGTIALVVFKNKVHVGFIAAIVAASNAGGSGSVVGDTTTTMMWIDGVSPLNVVHAFIAAIVALAITGWFAAHQQHKFQPIDKTSEIKVKVDWKKLMVVLLILVGAILSNFLYDMPALGVWVALIIGMTFTKLPWKEVPGAIKGTIFLLCLVTCASMMPVEKLPEASWTTAFILGFVSAVFDNIPLTKLCLEQGHYDWGMLAYSVGFGGSMIWFGSSAGVAITNKFPEARNVTLWLRKGWHVTLAYVVGFFVLYLIIGWEPADNRVHKEPAISCPAKECGARDQAKALEIFKQTKESEIADSTQLK